MMHTTTTEPKMANQASNTVYEITVWSATTNYHTQQEDGDVHFFDYTEAVKALKTWKELIEEGYLGAYVTVRKFKKDVWEAQSEYGIGMLDCQPPSKLPKYVQKHVGELLEATQDNAELFEWEELND